MKMFSLGTKMCLLALLAPLTFLGCGAESGDDGDGGGDNNGANNSTNNAGNGDNNTANNGGNGDNNGTNNGNTGGGHQIMIEDGMALIPAGDFWMGCNEALFDNCRPDEKPQHKVTLESFKMDVYEVTVGEFRDCINAGGCAELLPEQTYDGSGGFANYGGPVHDQHPINYTTIDQAQAYCGWLGKRLPSEAEWEKAARGGCEGYGSDCQTLMPTYPWGEDPPTCDKAFFTEEPPAVCDPHEGSGPFGTLSEVGGRVSGASPYGVQDMAGSLWEWTVDFYDEDFYANSPAKNPVATGDAGDATSDSGISIRGGGFNDRVQGGNNLRTTARSKQVPYDGIDYLGFRCVQ